MNARLPASALPLEPQALQSQVDAAWRESIVPELQRYIAVPAKSPMFDPAWAAHGLLERVLQNAADWVRAQQVPGLQLEIVNTTNSARIPNLLSNKVDLIISSLSITPDRQKAVDFSIPYGAIQAAVGAPKSMKLTGIEDLAGKTVAVTRGGPQDKIVTERAPQAKVVRFDDEAASITAAATGQADIVAITPPIIAAIAKKNPARDFETKFILQSYQLGVAMRKDQPELMKAVNGWIKTNLANGKLNDIHVKYAGVPIPKEIIDGAK